MEGGGRRKQGAGSSSWSRACKGTLPLARSRSEPQGLSVPDLWEGQKVGDTVYVARPAAGSRRGSYLKGAHSRVPQSAQSSAPDFPRALSTPHTPRRSGMAPREAVAGPQARRAT